MSYIAHFIPIVLFILCFVGSGIYFSILGTPNAFYQLSPVTAIIPAIALGWLLHKGTTQQRMHDFLDGVRHPDIITMCIIFLLAGAFSEVTKHIGSVDASVNLALSLIPSKFLLIGIFLISAFISSAIGTSMGTIATIAPIAAGLSIQADFLPALGVATVVGGAMFGENLSIISDTTIAAVMSQEAGMKKKLKLNAKVACVASILTIAILMISADGRVSIEAKEYSLLLVTPYIVLMLLAITGVNVFVALSISISFAGIIGLVTNHDYGVLIFSQDLNKGFAGMNEIMLLSLMVGGLSGLAGGLSGLAGKNFTRETAEKLSAWISKRKAGDRLSQLVIAKLVSIFDILLANNTIAIIFTGEIAREIAKKHKIPPHYSAAWLDIFSCVFPGIIPYGAQILLASTIAGLSPLAVIPYVYYCYVLGGVAILHIIFIKIERDKI